MASQLSAGEKGYLSRARAFIRTQPQPVLPERPRGYDPRVVKKDISDGKYICVDCHWILRDPLQSYCGHRYCKICFRFTISSGQVVKCGACINEGSETEFSILKQEQTFPDNGIKREMGMLPTECVNKACPWKGLFREYESHEPKCEFKSVQCDMCGWPFKPAQLDEHKRTDCPAKPAQCKYCAEQMTVGKLQTHERTCNQKPETCLGCKQTFPRIQLLEHSDPAANLCPNPIIPCLYGCENLISPINGKNHLEDDLDTHIAGLQLQIFQLQIDLKNAASVRASSAPVPQAATASAATAGSSAQSEVMAKVQSDIQRLEAQIKSQEAKLSEMSRRATRETPVTSAAFEPAGAVGGAPSTSDDAQRQINILEKKMMVFERVSAVFKREIEKIGKQTEELVRTAQENKERVEAVVRQITPVENSVTSQKAQILELQQRFISSEASSYDGILVWKISNFRQRRTDSVSRVTSFYSPCFFTSRTGYKACARIYLNGDGMGKGTHVSLFFVLMRGEYDGLLQWPFQQKVTLMWIDQNKRDNMVDTFRPDPTSSSFKRPTTDMNIASGCPLFMPLSTLDSPSQGYVKDDVGFIKIIIDKANLE